MRSFLMTRSKTSTWSLSNSERVRSRSWSESPAAKVRSLWHVTQYRAKTGWYSAAGDALDAGWARAGGTSTTPSAIAQLRRHVDLAMLLADVGIPAVMCLPTGRSLSPMLTRDGACPDQTSERCCSEPVLSPRVSIGTPSLPRSATCRLVNGVPAGTRRCRPPRSPLVCPPATKTGRSVCVCRFPSLIPEPY